MKKIILVLIVFFHFLTLASVEKKRLCVKYEASYGWSKGYEVEATVLSGYELYQKTHNIKHLTSSKYVLIFWQPGQASIIELDFPFINAIGTEGKDQEERKWIVTNTIYCY
jgi:hypothetical protein